MTARTIRGAFCAVTLVLGVCAVAAWSQDDDESADTTWRPSLRESTDDPPPTRPRRTRRSTSTQAKVSKTATRRTAARATSSKGSLPSGDGQVWREYDISAYTSRVDATSRPEQAVVDWILRETGYEVWHSEPVGLLSANESTLTVYHTPEMQAVVGDLVDRFTNAETETHAFALRVVTIDNPNWRARAKAMLEPVPVETQGTQAWLLEREDAALLISELRRRNDYREHSSPNLVVNNGQSAVVSATRSRPYVRDILLRPETWPGYENDIGQIDEGFSLELNPLLSVDGITVDAVLKCNIDQVERLRSVVVDVPTAAAPRQRAKIEVPQISHCRIHERFRWPANQVLLVGVGVVATPVPADRGRLRQAFGMMDSPARADLIVIVENRGKMAIPPPETARGTGGDDAKSYQGRY